MALMKAANLIKFLLIGIITLGGLTGCETKAGRVATESVDWVRSSLRMDLEENFLDVNEAVERACKDLKLVKGSAEADLVTSKFVYFNAKEETITITTNWIDQDNTEILVQVGLMGDRRQSQVIMDQILKRL
ncbi:MAG TPA: DUF3568 family protein [Oceanipulchritudo sp.]|nr:DUF3568 family protein [Oceanipulchritudo sp.]